MKKRLLVLTDHLTHSDENSIYRILSEMRRHPACGQIDVASRGLPENRDFYFEKNNEQLYGTSVGEEFSFHEDARCFKDGLRPLDLRSYDFVFMRLPHPTPKGFGAFLENRLSQAKFVNRPLGIELTGSKAFLLHFPEVSPPMTRCRTIGQVDAFRQKFPIVLKPLRSHGGQGIIRIDGDEVVSSDGKKATWDEFSEEIRTQRFDFLAVKFLQNVGEGDKRIIVCNGEIVGASLRKPAPGNWMCNISQGGSSHAAAADTDEREIVARIDPVLQEQGVIFYGVDTLMGDDGKRVLSEINTASIGGVKAIEEYSGQPCVRRVADLVWAYFLAD